jgi:hypothetical protein
MATPDQRVYDGDQAKLVLENEAFNQALNDIEAEITESWENSPARDQEGREQLWQLLKLAGKLRANLQTRLETGMLARIQIEEERKTMLQRARDLVGLS